jgi:GMP synthase-like glutamine amidotransferase
MQNSILVIENYPGRGNAIARLLRQFAVPFEVLASDGSELRVPSETAGLILSGGPQSVTRIASDEGAGLRAVLKVLDTAAQKNLPVLGICLGHQLLGSWAGGLVSKLSNKVVGFKQIHVHEKTAIFDGPNEKNITAFQYHEDHLETLPQGCEVLAGSESCGIEAFKIKERLMWGVQFHPELTLSDGRAILEGQPPPLLQWRPQTDLQAPYVIKAFTDLCLSKDGAPAGCTNHALA